jgi:hypothetical protein
MPEGRWRRTLGARTFPMYQIAWPNIDGHYPWEEAAPHSFKEWQPMLGSSSLADSRRRS